MKQEPAQLPFFQTCRRRYSAGSIGPLEACPEWSSRLSFSAFIPLLPQPSTTTYAWKLVLQPSTLRLPLQCHQAAVHGLWYLKGRALLNQIEGGRQLNRSKWPKNALFSMYPYHQGFDKQLLSMARTHSLKICLKKHSNTNILNKRRVFRLNHISQ